MKKAEEIRKNIEVIYEAMRNLKDIYNDRESTVKDILVVADEARLLNITDFERFITGWKEVKDDRSNRFCI